MTITQIKNWQNIIDRIEHWLFFAFLATFFLGIRKVLFHIPINNTFNEYLGTYLYLSDLLFLCWLVLNLLTIIYNNHTLLSMVYPGNGNSNHKDFWLKKSTLFRNWAKFPKISNLPQALKKKYQENLSSQYLFIALLILGWSFLSIYWSANKLISTYRFTKLLELFILIFFIVKKLVPHLPAGEAGGSIIIENNRDEWIRIIIFIKKYVKACLFGLLLISLVDHYIWDIWQGQLLLGLILSLVISLRLIEDKLKSGKLLFAEMSDVPRETILGQDTKRNVPSASSAGMCGTKITNIYKLLLGTCLVLMLNGLINAILAICQFLLQKSVGLKILGESIIAANIPGVAKIVLHEEILVRSYGFLPHPNILGGFLLVSIILTLLLIKLFHVEQSNNQILNICSTWNKSETDSQKNVPRGTLITYTIKLSLVIQAIGLLCTFSKSAILALLAALLYRFVPRGTNLTIKIKKLFHVEQSKVLIILVGILMTGLYFLRFEVYSLFAQSISERSLYLSISERIIAESPIIGVGTGQFILASEKLFPSLDLWQYQPVHNVYLLIWSEWGIVGLVLFILFLWKLFHVEQV